LRAVTGLVTVFFAAALGAAFFGVAIFCYSRLVKGITARDARYNEFMTAAAVFSPVQRSRRNLMLTSGQRRCSAL
jgi:TM2 domain-containing membrane protein YozV